MQMLVKIEVSVIVLHSSEHSLSCKRMYFCLIFSIEKLSIFGVRFEVFVAVKIKFVVFWVVMPCSMIVGYQRFRGLCWLCL